MSASTPYPAPATQRARFADAGEATRSTLSRAAAASPPLNQREWRVLAAVLQLTTTYSKLTDRVWQEQVAAAAGGLDRRAVQRALGALHERFLIVWEPSTVKGRPSTVGVVPSVRAVAGAAPSPVVRAVAGAAPTPDFGRSLEPPDAADWGGRCDPDSGGHSDRPPRKYQGETSSCAAEGPPDGQEEEASPVNGHTRAGEVVAAVRERHPAARVLATDLAPLRAAIAGALRRGCDGAPLAAALSGKVGEAATVGLLVALARDADPADYPTPPPASPPSPATARDLALHELAERDPALLARLLGDAEYDARDGHRVPDLDTAPPQLRERILEAAYSRLVALQPAAPAS